MRIVSWLIILLLVFSTVNGNGDDHDDEEENDNDDHTTVSTEGTPREKGNIGEKMGIRESEHGNSSRHSNTSNHGSTHGIRLASWRWADYGIMFNIAIMIIFAVIAKITFHHITWLSKTIPESVVLITVGFIMSIIINSIHESTEGPSNFPKFTAYIFFNVLLPPIILDAAFALFDREFLANFRSVITFAIIGTLINVFAIGYTLYGLSKLGAFGQFYGGKAMRTFSLTATQCLIFSSLISAVDPVAVLAIFEEIHVNLGLYFLVFGESLLNDGVTVVLYNTMISMESMESIGIDTIFVACISFFFVFFGGFLIGMLWGALASFITTKTGHVRVVEPLLIFSSAYMSFVFAELVHWSGILSIIGFGLTVKRYAFANISQKSYHTVKYATKTLASVSDCIIFIYLGSVLWLEAHEVNWSFILATIMACLVYRLLSTFFLSWLTNISRANKISIQEQVIMAYGGLRGAVGFSLAVVLEDPAENHHATWYRHIFVSGALAMVIFTVFLQGSTIKPLVKLLKIKLQQIGGKKLVSSEMQMKMVDDMMAGIEIIVGHKGTWAVWEYVRRFDSLYIKRFLTTEIGKETLQRKFERIILDEHYANLYAPNIMVSQSSEGNGKRLTSTPSEDLKTLEAGIYNHHMDRSTGSRYMVNQLEMRSKRTKTMEGAVLKRRMTQNISPNDDTALLRVIPTSTLNRTSISSQLIKSEYDTIQANKKKRMSQVGRARSNTHWDIVPLIEEDRDIVPLVEEDVNDFTNEIKVSPV